MTVDNLDTHSLYKLKQIATESGLSFPDNISKLDLLKQMGAYSEQTDDSEHDQSELNSDDDEDTPGCNKKPTKCEGLLEIANNHQCARNYAKEGFWVLPCWPDSKKPLTPNGFSDATKDLNLIDYWWERCPQANVAIQTRDLLVLDVDCKNGVDGLKTINSLEKTFGKLPETKTQNTPSGGLHYIYKTRNIIVPSMINCPGEGLDIRAYSGYILAEPSTIDGKSYVMDATEISEAPIWLVNLIYANSAFQTEDIYHSEIKDSVW